MPAVIDDRPPIGVSSPRVVNVALLGYGRVGQAVAAAAAETERATLNAAGLDVCCVGALVRNPAKLRRGPALRLTTDPDALFADRVDVVIEVLGGVEPARTIVSRALALGIPVVTANKSLVAAHGAALSRIAAEARVGFAWDAAVLAGVPCLGALARRPIVAAAARIEAILNGTSQFIVGAMNRGVSFDDALVEAVARGYAEPDSAADTSGRDAAEKLSILLRLAGAGDVSPRSLPTLGLDALEAATLLAAGRLGGVIKPVAFASLDQAVSGAWVGPAFVSESHPLSKVDGVDNQLRIIGPAGRVVTFAGPGAGPAATAATILDDVAEIAAGLPVATPVAHGRRTLPHASFAAPPPGRWLVVAGQTRPWDAEPDGAGRLTARDVPVDRAVATDTQVAALTPYAPWAEVLSWLVRLRAAGDRAVALPVLGGVK